MKQFKKTLLTLVALLAVTTGAWADETLLLTIESKDNTDFKNGGSKTFDDKVTVTFSDKVKNDGDNGGWFSLSASLLTVTGINGCTITSCKFYTNDGTATTGYTVEGESPSVYLYVGQVFTDASKSVKIGEPGINKIEVYTAPSASSGPEVAWDKAANTGSFTMPGGNVTLEPDYYPQAALAAAPTAIDNVPATTDGAIVSAGTVKKAIDDEMVTDLQGTVMYYAAQVSGDAAPTAPDYDAEGWTEEVPTAANFAQGKVYVWYYIKGADGNGDEYIFSDSEITALGTEGYVTIAAEPTYAVTFADDLAEPDKWTAEPAAGVKKGTAVTVTYTGTRKVIGVKAEKKAAAGPNEVLTYSFDDASHPSGLTAGSRVSFDYSRTSVITNSKFLNAYNNTNGDPNATTVSLGDTDLSGETWTLSFEWAACGGCNIKPDHTTLKAGDATLFDLNGNSNWNTTVTIIYTGSDGSKTLPVPRCDNNKRFTAAVGDQYNTTTYWHHIVVTGSAEGVKMTITNSSTGAAVVEDVVLSETNVNPTSLIIEPCCGGGIGIDALSLTYEE